ncbi:hypothetical protein ACFE04_001171 [Oxalis oulophora]
MQSRGNEGSYRTLSPSGGTGTIRSQQKYESGHDPYQFSRSISPQNIDDGSGSRRRVLVSDRKNDSVQGREYGWCLGEGRTEKVLQRSPSSYGQQQQQQRIRSHFDFEKERIKYEFVDHNVDDINSSEMKDFHGYDAGNARVSRERNYSDDGRGINNPRRFPVEEGAMRGPCQLSPSLQNIDVGRFEYEGRKYREPANSDNVALVERYEEEKQQHHNMRDVPKFSQSARHSMDVAGKYHFKEYIGNSSSGISSSGYLPSSDDYQRNSGKFTEHTGKDMFGEKPQANITRERDYETRPRTGPRNTMYHQPNRTMPDDGAYQKEKVSLNDDREYPPLQFIDDHEYPPRQSNDKRAYHPPRQAHDDREYASRQFNDERPYYPPRQSNDDREYPPRQFNDDPEYPPRQFNENREYPPRQSHDDRKYPPLPFHVSREYPPRQFNDDCEYPPRQSKDLNRTRPVHTRLGYDHTLTDSDRIDSGGNIRHHVVGRIKDTEFSSENHRKNRSSLHEEDYSECIDMRKQRDNNLASDCTYRKKIPEDCDISHLGSSGDRQIPNSRPRPAYQMERDISPEFQKGRYQNHPLSMHDQEINRFSLNPQKTKHGTPGNLLKRKYGMEEQINEQNFEDTCYESEEELIDEDMNRLSFSRQEGFDHREKRKAQRTYHEGRQHHGRDFVSDEWLTSQNSFGCAPRHTVKFYKNNGGYIKPNPRYVSYNSYKPHNTNRPNYMHKHHKVWQKNEDYDNEYVNDVEQSDDCMIMAGHDKSEDTDEFKQMVHEAFLDYSKKINANSVVQKRYKDQGKSGSVFCIACGRSDSKEFLDTQRLVTHAFMSHKTGLRAKHLGLLKAICVLLGWNTTVPLDTVTWCPEVLPAEEASIQKEDLILWPPLVVIHNISMSNNNPMVQKVVPIEGIREFLRDKGIVGGKITVSLGKPADQSVMVVKFMNTFTGLRMAEKLHNYFLENNHGRREFEQNKADKNWETDIVEQLLYGYTGIAEDFDRLDFNSKNFCTIKSKKEILDMANDPVKPDNK